MTWFKNGFSFGEIERARGDLSGNTRYKPSRCILGVEKDSLTQTMYKHLETKFHIQTFPNFSKKDALVSRIEEVARLLTNDFPTTDRCRILY